MAIAGGGKGLTIDWFSFVTCRHASRCSHRADTEKILAKNAHARHGDEVAVDKNFTNMASFTCLMVNQDLRPRPGFKKSGTIPKPNSRENNGPLRF